MSEVTTRANNIHHLCVIVSLMWVSMKYWEKDEKSDWEITRDGEVLDEAIARFRSLQDIPGGDYGRHYGFDLAAIKSFAEQMKTNNRRTASIPELVDMIDPDWMPDDAPLEYEVALVSALESAAELIQKILEQKEKK